MEIMFYIPTHNKEYIKEISKSLCLINGGLTIINNCFGLWIDNAKMYKDDITLIQILINEDKETLAIKLKMVKNLALRMKRELKQLSFLYTINKQPIFV